MAKHRVVRTEEPAPADSVPVIELEPRFGALNDEETKIMAALKEKRVAGHGKEIVSPTNALVQVSLARRWLAECSSPAEFQDVRAKAKALQEYLRRRNDSHEAKNIAGEICVRAERAIGRWSAELEKATPPGKKLPGAGNNSADEGKLSALKAEGITTQRASEWEKIAAIPDEVFEEFIAESKAQDGAEITTAAVMGIAQRLARAEKERQRQASRDENAKEVAKHGSINTLEDLVATGARFPSIVIDPPWDWGDEGDVDQLGRARPDYTTMTIDEIRALPVAKLADADGHLYLWITNRSLPKGFPLLEAWGYRYVTAITWAKPHFGMGNYFRGQTEHVLFGVRGSQPLARKDVGTLLTAKRPGGHSAKPDEFFALAESCSPGPRLEMFSRVPRPGWTCWGQDGVVTLGDSNEP